MLVSRIKTPTNKCYQKIQGTTNNIPKMAKFNDTIKSRNSNTPLYKFKTAKRNNNKKECFKNMNKSCLAKSKDKLDKDKLGPSYYLIKKQATKVSDYRPGNKFSISACGTKK
jgi:hypothetical protein